MRERQRQARYRHIVTMVDLYCFCSGVVSSNFSDKWIWTVVNIARCFYL